MPFTPAIHFSKKNACGYKNNLITETDIPLKHIQYKYLQLEDPTCYITQLSHNNALLTSAIHYRNQDWFATI